MAGPHPPSEQRIAEARASGHLPRVPLLWLSSLLVVLALAAQLGAGLAHDLVTMLRAPLEGDSARAFAALASIRHHVLLGLGTAFLALLAFALLVQRPGSGRARAFPALRVDPTASLLWSAGVALLAGLYAFDVYTPLDFAGWAWSLSALSAACLAIDIAFARARWFASLWMTRREYVDAQREQGPAPELVRARRSRA